MTSRPFLTILMAAAVLVVPLLAVDAAGADSPARLVAEGNDSYRKGDFDGALELYEKASVRMPESPVITFNMGGAFYRKEDYQKAREYFENAAVKARDLTLEARAWYNVGNCAFRQGGRQIDGDLQKAIDSYQESVRFYTTALEKDPGLTDAAHNIEVARLVIKDLLDKLQKQQEEQKEQQDRLKEVVDSLVALITRQEAAAGRSEELGRDAAKRAGTWKKEFENARGVQEGIMDGTEGVQGKLDELFPDEKPPQVTEASSHLDSSLVDQVDALNDLAGERPGEASNEQDEAAGQMRKALALLTQQPQQGQQSQQEQPPQQQPAQQEQQVEQQKRDETARDILEEEKENKKQRKQVARGGYRSVDKDW